MIKTFYSILVLALSLTFSLNVCALALESDSFQEIKQTVLEKGKKYGVEDVLVVFDIDNTLLTMSQNFGSDQWFGWQSSNCFGNEKLPEFCVADDFDELLDIQGQIFALSNMLPTEKAASQVVRDLQERGFTVILLTSRGPNFRNSTERALALNNFDLSKTPLVSKAPGASAKGFPSTYLPYFLKSPEKSGLTPEDLKKAGNKSPRLASYMNGIFMTSGLHKGLMLKTLLAKTKRNFEAIVFADDHQKHTKAMQEIFGSAKGVNLTTFRYSKIDPQVKAFLASDKKDSIKAWETLKKASEAAFE